MEVQAQLKFTRLSPRKVKLVIDLVRGKTLAEAERQLNNLSKGSAKPVIKLIKSAAANGKSNLKLEPSDWWVKTIQVNQGPVLKRWQPKAMGRATPLRRPTSHIKVVLSDVAPKSASKK
ncbi:50S ribosomal protein L22 [Patescibacteria group bacterium]|nr:50S ribosomal protein L22 [Patescibacteria group bacterium]